MGEIKSTLEIALEKAKAVEISSEDRERFKREKLVSEARNIFQQYVSRPNRLGDLSEAIEGREKDPSLLKQCLIDVFLGALDRSRSSERIWQGLQELGLEDPGPFREAFTRIAEDEDRARREEAEKVKIAIRESLARAGISGSAVDPNLEESSPWKEVLHSLDERASAERERLRSRIATAIERRSSSPRSSRNSPGSDPSRE